MRALLVVNHSATTTSARTRDVLTRALRTEVDLEIAQTKRRGHGAELAYRAARDGVDVVVALGGDGTVNEVVNGLLTDGPSPSLPDLAVVPGGSTNVFARSLGLPMDPVDATGALLEALREGRRRSIGLGTVDDRWFTFCAGFGFDAEVIHRVERARHRGRKASRSLYIRAALAQYLDRPHRSAPLINLRRPDGKVLDRLSMAIIQNTTPWTYWGEHPVNACPDASFDTGLDIMAIREMKAPTVLHTVGQILSRNPRPRGRQVFGLHDVSEFTLTSPLPVALQVDGDYIGDWDSVVFRATPDALRVVL